jgi:hypothetical protein
LLPARTNPAGVIFEPGTPRCGGILDGFIQSLGGGFGLAPLV